MNKSPIIATITIFLCNTIASLPANGCAFSIDPYFTYTNHPDFPLKKYAAGQLGILQPGYARSYLIPAYRYLSGLPLSQEEQKDMVTLWDDRLTALDGGYQNDASSWLKERNALPGVKKIESISTERAINPDEPWQTYCNCQTSAFETASKKLKELITKYGASSNEVNQWLQAQDEVFSNCGSPSYGEKPKPAAIPAPLPATADQSLQKDRFYQIAAANFYAQNLENAQKEFEAIAADAASPWKQVSAYLAVRSMIRQATLAKTLDLKILGQAQNRIKELSADPAYAGMSADLASLNSFISARLDPAQHLQELAKEKLTTASTCELTKTIDSLTGDGNDADSAISDYAKLPASLKALDSIDWIVSFQTSDEASNKHALEKWKQTHSLPWLVAAAAAADSDNPDADAIINAAEGQSNTPAKWTLRYHSNRLNIGKDRLGTVRANLDKILSAPPVDLPVSSLNQFKTQRLTLAKSLDEIVRFGLQNPAGICTSGGTEQVPDDVADLEKHDQAAIVPVVFTPEAADIIDNKLPLSAIKELANNKMIPNNLRSHLAWTAWVRAVLIGDNATAKTLAETLKTLNKAKQPLVDGYLNATTPEARKFAATFLMMQFSSAQPNVGYGPLTEDGYGDASGWWWAASPTVKYDVQSATPIETFEPEFLNATQKAQVQKEITKLKAVPTAPDYFAQTVLAWAKTHPTDDRLPKALHFAVKSTRYGITDNDTSDLSKECFQLLHTRYKTSPWTKKTPYWY